MIKISLIKFAERAIFSGERSESVSTPGFALSDFVISSAIRLSRRMNQPEKTTIGKNQLVMGHDVVNYKVIKDTVDFFYTF